MKYDCNPTCPSRKPFKKRSTVGAAYMPPAHLAYTTNLTHHHPVGAGHARPATYPILQLVSIAQQINNMHLAQKSPSKFVEKIKNNP